MRDDWTTYRFVIYDSWVAFDVTTLLASGPHTARFSAFDVTAPLSRGPRLARFWTEPEVQFHAFRRLKHGEKKGFEKKSFHVEISISLRIDLANKKKSVIYTLIASTFMKGYWFFGAAALKHQRIKELWMTSNRHILSSFSILGLVFGHASSIWGRHYFR